MAKNETVKRWEDYGKEHLLGRTIVGVRYLSDEEQEALGFYRKALVIQFDDGTIIFPSADDEGNDAGAIFGQAPDGSELTFPVI